MPLPKATGDTPAIVETETIDLRSLRGIVKARRSGVTVRAMAEAIKRGASER